MGRLKLAAFALALLPVGTAGASEDLTIAHVHRAMAQISQDVELIRETMGRPRVTARPWIVIEAEMRHVYYQMQTVLRDVNRLDRELMGEGAELPTVPLAEIEVGHLQELATATLAGLDRIRARLGITYRTEPGEIDRRRGTPDVLREAVQVDRQLELMLDRPIVPADVYDRLMLAAAYVAGALTENPEEPDYGDLPPFEPHKMPADVYRRVLECLAIAQEIDREHGIPVLQLDLRRELRRQDIEPPDVYHLATIVLTELAHLTMMLDAEYVDLPPIERPELIFPAHVYQIAGMLQNQMARLESKLAAQGVGDLGG